MQWLLLPYYNKDQASNLREILTFMREQCGSMMTQRLKATLALAGKVLWYKSIIII